MTNEEQQSLIMALAHGSDTFTEDDAVKVVKWADGVITEYAILDLALRGELDLAIVDGEVAAVRKEANP